MLRTRVITALLLAAGLFAAVFLADTLLWAWLIAAVAALGGWEFGRLGGWGRGAALFGGWVFLLCAAVIVFQPQAVGAPGAFGDAPLLLPVLVAAALFWLLLVPLWLRYRWPLQPVLALPVGTLLLFPTWLALVQLRLLHPWLLVALLALVSFADIAAYFTGRRFGRRKLAPAISPGKTWEGAWGAIAVVFVYGFAVAYGAGWLAGGEVAWRLALLAVLLPLLTFVSIAGDLFESLLKRQSGMKDSSQLLPGHGGILDRIDSLTAALPVATLILLLVNQV